MRILRLQTFLGVIVCFFAALGTCFGGVIWYNGDWDGVNGLSNEQNPNLVTQAAVYDDFVVPAGGFVIQGLFSNNIENLGTLPDAAYWEIRSGLSEGNGGAVVAAGATDTDFSWTATGRTGGGYTEYTLAVTLEPAQYFSLPPGTYWLAVWPSEAGQGQMFISNTTGLNAIGIPPGDNSNSFFNSSYFAVDFGAASNYTAGGDFSMGLIGESGVPEPASFVLIGLGLVSLGLLRRRRTRAS